MHGTLAALAVLGGLCHRRDSAHPLYAVLHFIYFTLRLRKRKAVS